MNNIVKKCIFDNSRSLSRTLYTSSYAKNKVMPGELEHATGPEKKELLARAAGNEHPFDMKVFKRTSGGLENPTLIPSLNEARIVGCICEEESTCINWMWLQKGEVKRCECGYHFKLVDGKPM